MSCSLHVSIVGLFTIRQKRIRGGSTYAECNSGPLKEHLLLARPTIASLPCLARRDTIESVQLPKHHTRCTLNWTVDAGIQAGRRHGMSETGWRMGGRDGGREQGASGEGGSKGRSRGSDDMREGESGSGGREGRLRT